MASTDENPGLLARFYGSRQESSESTRRRSVERPFPHNVQRGSTAASAAANCLYPDTTRGRRNVGRAAETLTSRPGRKDPFTGALERGATDEVKDAIADESGRVTATDLHALDSSDSGAHRAHAGHRRSRRAPRRPTRYWPAPRSSWRSTTASTTRGSSASVRTAA